MMTVLGDKTHAFTRDAIRIGVDFWRDGIAICWHLSGNRAEVVGSFNWKRDSRIGQREAICAAFREARREIGARR